jgi:hypothetical protein
MNENFIIKQLNYFDKLDDKALNKLYDKLFSEQALLSTFMQQNLDNIFPDNEKIKDFTLNIYILLLYLFKTKLKNKYRIIDKPYLDNILNINKFENPYEDLGDFIFTQYINEDFEKNDFIDAIKLLNVVITCFVTSH